MEQHDLNNGLAYTGLSFIAWIFSMITLDSVLRVIPAVSGLISVAAGIMAIRYYYYSTKKIKGGK